MVRKGCSILLVDNDQENARVMVRILKELGHSVLAARDGAHALSILEFRGFEVLVIDIESARVDGKDLIIWAGRMCPRTRIVAMGVPASEGVQRSIMVRGASLFLRKPVEMDKLREFLTPVRTRSSFTGMVEGVDIIEYVQFMMLNGGKTVLEITSSVGTRGRIYLSDGMAIHAVCGILQGEQALYRCLRFREGTFAHLPWHDPDQITISKPGEFLLMEAVRKRDDAWGDSSDTEGGR